VIGDCDAGWGSVDGGIGVVGDGDE